MSTDQFWSIFAMPIGLLICFGPAVAVWLVAELRSPPPSERKQPRRR
jgi:hypothetical protein